MTSCGMINARHALGMPSIAERVETAELLAQLHSLGCHLAQGNYFSEPLLGEAASVLLKKYSGK